MAYLELLTPNDGEMLKGNLANALTFIGQAQECLKPACTLWQDLNKIWEQLDDCAEMAKETACPTCNGYHEDPNDHCIPIYPAK